MNATKNSSVKKLTEKEFEAGFEPMRQGFEGAPDQFADNPGEREGKVRYAS